MNDAVVAYSLASILCGNLASGFISAGAEGLGLLTGLLGFVLIYAAGFSYTK